MSEQTEKSDNLYLHVRGCLPDVAIVLYSRRVRKIIWTDTYICFLHQLLETVKHTEVATLVGGIREMQAVHLQILAVRMEVLHQSETVVKMTIIMEVVKVVTVVGFIVVGTVVVIETVKCHG